MKTLPFILLLLLSTTCLAMDKPNALVNEKTGEVIAIGWTTFKDYDLTDKKVIQADKIPDTDVRYYKYFNGKITERTDQEKKEVTKKIEQEIQKSEQERLKKQQNRTNAISKLQKLGLKDEEITSLMER